MTDEVPVMWPRMILAYGVIFLVVASLAWFPRSWWTRSLTTRVGPNLDPSRQTRRETFRSAAGFLLIAGYALGTIYISEPLFEWALGRDPWYDQGFNAILFLCGIAFMVGIAGALYLGVRAMFRPAVLYRWAEDELSRSEFLKTYAHAGEGEPVLIVHHEVGDYEAFVVGPPPAPKQLGVVNRGFPWGTLRSLGRWPTLEEAETVARAQTANS